MQLGPVDCWLHWSLTPFPIILRGSTVHIPLHIWNANYLGGTHFPWHLQLCYCLWYPVYELTVIYWPDTQDINFPRFSLQGLFFSLRHGHCVPLPWIPGLLTILSWFLHCLSIYLHMLFSSKILFVSVHTLTHTQQQELISENCSIGGVYYTAQCSIKKTESFSYKLSWKLVTQYERVNILRFAEVESLPMVVYLK